MKRASIYFAAALSAALAVGTIAGCGSQSAPSGKRTYGVYGGDS